MAPRHACRNRNSCADWLYGVGGSRLPHGRGSVVSATGRAGDVNPPVTVRAGAASTASGPHRPSPRQVLPTELFFPNFAQRVSHDDTCIGVGGQQGWCLVMKRILTERGDVMHNGSSEVGQVSVVCRHDSVSAGVAARTRQPKTVGPGGGRTPETPQTATAEQRLIETAWEDYYQC